MSYPIHKISGGSRSVVTRTEEGFLGLGAYNSGIGQSLRRAADTLNLIWEGEALRRRPCCAPLLQVSAPVYGLFFYGDDLLIHAGEQLLRYTGSGEPTILFSGMNPAPSRSVLRHQQVEERRCADNTANGWYRRRFEADLLFICDGKNYWFYDGEAVHSCADEDWEGERLAENSCFYGTVPETMVAKLPEGGGDVDPRGDNLLSRFRTESFYVDATETKSFLLNAPLSAIQDGIPMELRLRDDTGLWRTVNCIENYSYVALPEGTRFETNLSFSAGMTMTLNEEERITALKTGNRQIAADGMDNLMITYAVRKDYPNTLAGATVMGLYGPDGSNSVLFLGGSAQTPGVDHFSAPDDFLCFYESCYEQLGNRDTPITGYCPLKDGRLAVLKNDPGESAVYFRSHRTVEVGVTMAGEHYLVDAYPAVAGAAVEGCLSSDTVGRAGNEPCFLTGRGIYTVKTVSDELINLNETILRSRAVNPLLKEWDLSGARATNWRDLYLLFLGSTALITDGRTDGEGSYRFLQWQLPISVTAAVAKNDTLYLAGPEGILYQMNEAQTEAFPAYWQTTALEEQDGLKMIFQRMELLITPGFQTEASFCLLRNGKEYWPRFLKPVSGKRPCWVPIASRFGSANDLALRFSFPENPEFRLWGLRIVYRKGSKR